MITFGMFLVISIMDIPLKKLANWVLPPLAAKTELREKDAVSGKDPLKMKQNELYLSLI